MNTGVLLCASENSNEVIDATDIEKKVENEPNPNFDNPQKFKCISCYEEFLERYLLIKHYDTFQHQDVTIVVNIFKNE